MKNIKVVAFDCDGVMFDTKDANTAYYNRILNHFGRPDMTPEQSVFSQMHTVDKSISFLFHNDGKAIKTAQAFRKKMRYFSFIPYMKIEPFLIPLLKKLKHICNTAVATNRTDTMNSVITEHGLEGYFDLVVSALDVKYPKPHPEQLLKIMNYFNIKSHQALYIGDSELDEQAAAKAGVPLIAYKNPSLSADFHIESLKEVENILEL